MTDDYEEVDGFHLYGPIFGDYVIADAGGWIPGKWAGRDEALAGGRAYAEEFGAAPFGDDDDEEDDEETR